MRSKISEILTSYWGYSTFRPLQEDIILSVLEGKDTLALLPTGGGKSICFQVPALAKEGLCLVISPLIALMKDQVGHLTEKGIPAASLVSGMNYREIDTLLDNCIYGKYKFLYVSPERLTSEMFLERLRQMRINLIAVDEAHCISQWGYDFRPPYLQIAAIREFLPGVPVLALTATATTEVRKDIQKQLHFNSKNIFIKSFERKNLSYVVLREEDKTGRLLKIVKTLKGSGVVYVRTRKKAQEVSEILQKNDIRSGFYHAGLSQDLRSRIQNNWKKGTIRVVVATNAFGMGIDKSDVRFVVHLDLPDSPEAYYQEAGRGGRDEKRAFAVLLFNDHDPEEMEERARLAFPETSTVKLVYQALGNFFQLPVGSGKGISFAFDIREFSTQYNLQPGEVFNCIRVLELQGLLSYTDSPGMHSRLHFTIGYDQVYQYQVSHPGTDHFLKILLRSYEGLFSDYVIIHESDLALRSGIPLSACISNLKSLSRMKILDYIPASDMPQITFTEERQDIKNILIDRQHLAERKQRFQIKARYILDYASRKDECRSKLLLAYFGEESLLRCGNCDYCLERNKIDISDLELNLLHTKIAAELKNKKVRLEDLVNHLQPGKEKQTMKVVEWLMDNRKIRFSSGNFLEWVE